jgi:hypothetical protein
MTTLATSSPELSRALNASVAGRDVWRWILVAAAAGNVLNGAWMLADPSGWYTGIPAAVPDFGPLNEHFVRDIGAAFLVQGAALAWAAFAPRWRVPLVAPVVLFYVLHALAHVYDTARGLVGPAHWAIDFPAVYLPALLMIVLLWLLARADARAARV